MPPMRARLNHEGMIPEQKMEERNFPHAMLREIYEQPQTLAATLEYFTKGDELCLQRFMPMLATVAEKEQIVIAASGSSRHAGLAGEIVIEDLSGLPVDVEYASEYIYRSTRFFASTCLAVLSQSGETADTLEAVREASTRGTLTVAITNRENSSMARRADCSLPTQAGVEMAVPATKSFTAQLLVLQLLALFLAKMRGRMTAAELAVRLAGLRHLPYSVAESLAAWEAQVAGVARKLKQVDTYLFLGRGIHYPIAREGALKLKESAYLAAEGYPAGELKHGPNALVADSSCLVVLATRDVNSSDSVLRYRKTVQLLRDMKQQGASMVVVASEGDDAIAEICEDVILVPACDELLAPILEVVPLQLLAYFSAFERGINMDAPRNLAKAVLVE